jgi:hypothetical protein
VPVPRYLGEPWVVRSTQGPLEGSGRFKLAAGLHAGAQVAYKPERSTSESDFLVHHDVPTTPSGPPVTLFCGACTRPTPQKRGRCAKPLY